MPARRSFRAGVPIRRQPVDSPPLGEICYRRSCLRPRAPLGVWSRLHRVRFSLSLRLTADLRIDAGGDGYCGELSPVSMSRGPVPCHL